jgi:hypothetical protein
MALQEMHFLDVFMNLTHLEELDFSYNPALMQLDWKNPPLR